MNEFLPCPLCGSTKIDSGICYLEDKSKSEPAVRCVDCGCRATLAAWHSRTSAQGAAQPNKAWQCLAVSKAACAWPDCGCDPEATKVIAALVDQGWEPPKSSDGQLGEAGRAGVVADMGARPMSPAGVAPGPSDTHLGEIDQIAFELEEWMRQPDWADEFSLGDMVRWMEKSPIYLIQKLRQVAASQRASEVTEGQRRGPSEPLQCLRCGTIDAFGPVSKKDAVHG